MKVLNVCGLNSFLDQEDYTGRLISVYLREAAGGTGCGESIIEGLLRITPFSSIFNHCISKRTPLERPCFKVEF